ncbi:pentatricopeptide repeat-containing protein, mitochondrial-like [Thalictrum thalictroides]|uniref:Pentatricopeptide repeat-containing protein, mitochondrial-like n=1 Tax=Thalictrum thalictroides TaxID=46969 RepID=A0A7J6X4E8_THATH|nr:pentatricopeptide repeat-containing protein, mitochondrial-like [Thalictrum thalictroides]
MQGLLLNGGKISKAVELFKEFHSSRVKPDLISYNFLIRTYCNDGNLEAAIRTYNRLLKNGYIPNRMTLEMLIPSICEKGDIDHARSEKDCESSFKIEDKKGQLRWNPSLDNVLLDVLVEAAREGKKNWKKMGYCCLEEVFCTQGLMFLRFKHVHKEIKETSWEECES